VNPQNAPICTLILIKRKELNIQGCLCYSFWSTLSCIHDISNVGIKGLRRPMQRSRALIKRPPPFLAPNANCKPPNTLRDSNNICVCICIANRNGAARRLRSYDLYWLFRLGVSLWREYQHNAAALPARSCTATNLFAQKSTPVPQTPLGIALNN